jgi:hypothetical protein
MPSGRDPMGGLRFSEKIMLKQSWSATVIQPNPIALYATSVAS